MLCKIDEKHLLVTGPQRSVDVLDAKNLRKLANLNTDGKLAFCAMRIGNRVFVGCMSGSMFSWRVDDDDSSFEDRDCVQVNQKIAQMLHFTA